MKYILLPVLFSLMVFSAVAYSAPVNQCSSSSSPVHGSYSFYVVNGSVHTNINGCDYKLPDNRPVPSYTPRPDGSSDVFLEDTWYSTGNAASIDVHTSQEPSFNLDRQTEQLKRYCSQASSGCDKDGFPVDAADWLKFKEKDDAVHNKPSQTPGDNPDTPPVTPPENPFPENASLGQLRDLLTNCQRDAGRMPTADSEHYEPGPDYAYNARVRQCNAIYDRLVSQLPVGAMSAPSPDKQTFITKSGAGALYSCKPNNLSPQEWADKGLLYPGPVVGSPWRNMPERKIPKCEVINAGTGDEHTQCDYDLSFNYGKDDGSGTTYCNSVYNAHVSGGGSDNPGDASPQAPGGGTGHAVPGQINCPSGLAPGTVCLGVPGAPEGEWAPCPLGSNPEYMCYGTGGTASPDNPSGGAGGVPPGGTQLPPGGISPCVGEDCTGNSPFDYERMGRVMKDKLSESYDDNAARSLTQQGADKAFSGVTGALDNLSDSASGLLNGGVVGDGFAGASSQMAQIGSGSSSPLLDRFKLNGLPSPSECRPLVFGAGQPYELSIDCDKINLFKQIFAFLLYVGTFIYLYQVFTSLPSRNKE
ncbi:hypothetical protein AH814_22250 [Salmonella enterica subsp. enterica serovar Rubislaw]|nr:hypothetical protein [Salmonella enterica subsp. enterica serovar Rubislaw]